ncbi:MAG: hypothetical protein GX493_11130, partial [Firmicutes bacterium]|nr:hypothetical protein [Bacillota bacterium]
IMPHLAAATYRVFRRPSVRARARFTRWQSRFLLLQRELESWQEKLAVLEREIRRRLEYQDEWQELMNKQIKLQQKREEIARLLEKAAELPSEILADQEARRRWLDEQREKSRRREKILLAWQDFLREEKAWVARMFDEPFTVFGDRSLLAWPGLTSGARLIMVALETQKRQTPETMKAQKLATDWFILDAAFKLEESGQGFGGEQDPLVALAEELAGMLGVGTQEALETLGLLRR